MSLVGNITTGDGVNHTAAHGLCYPLQIQTLAGDPRVRLTLHAWHSEAARSAGASELDGYPLDLEWHGEAALAAIVAGLSAMSSIAWTGNPIADAQLAEQAIIAAMETAVCAQMPQFSRVPATS